jgi:hypothetical protein
MEVQFEPAVQAKLDRISRESGREPADLVQDAVALYVEECHVDDLAETSSMLDSRYNDIKSGKVKLIDGAEAYALQLQRIAARRNGRA